MQWAFRGQPWRRKRALKREGYGLYWSKREQEEEGGGGKGKEGGERGGGGGGGGAGVLNSEKNGKIRLQPSLIGRMS